MRKSKKMNQGTQENAGRRVGYISSQGRLNVSEQNAGIQRKFGTESTLDTLKYVIHKYLHLSPNRVHVG